MKIRQQKANFTLRLVAAFLAVVLCVGAVGILSTNSAQASTSGRVLFISSYSYAWETVRAQIAGLQEGMGSNISIDYEFMDTKRVDDETSAELFYEGLKYRLSQVDAYDVIIVGDDAAFQFAIQYKEELFAGKPVLFLGVNDTELAAEMAESYFFAGLVEEINVKENINIALKFYPDATNVVAIVDDSVSGQADLVTFYAAADAFPKLTFSDINTSELTTSALRLALTKLSSDTIIIYLSMSDDASGRAYTNEEAIALLISQCQVPIFRMVDSGIGQGLIGGYVVSMELSGKVIAEYASAIIKGSKSCSNLGLLNDTVSIYYFDEDVIESFGLDASVLPLSAELLNHEPGFLESNKTIIIVFCIMLLFLCGVMVWIWLDGRKHKKLYAELDEAKDILQNASEHDFLTGLHNRSRFMHDLEFLIENKTPCTVLMLDIDDFKKINDNFGHKGGDEALQQIAARMKENHSQILTAYRYAGDEFIMILESAQSRIVEKAAYQCRQIFAKPCIIDGEKYHVCGSIGIASYPKDTEDLERLIECADQAMYQIKKSGKNNFAFYQAGMDEMDEE